MRLITSTVGGLAILGCALGGTMTFADDRDGDAPATLRTVVESLGVIVRVPVDNNGNENTDQAEFAVAQQAQEDTTEGLGLVAPEELPLLWESAQEIAESAVAPVDSSTDASTWWGWNNYRGWGWRQPYYYYHNYRPWFNYYGNYYGYYGNYYRYYPSYWNAYYPNRYYGHRYYYYPRYW